MWLSVQMSILATVRRENFEDQNLRKFCNLRNYLHNFGCGRKPSGSLPANRVKVYFAKKEKLLIREIFGPRNFSTIGIVFSSFLLWQIH